MASDRQKYNFLAAFVKQLDQAQDENDDLAEQFLKVVGLNALADKYASLQYDLDEFKAYMDRTYDDLNKWLARVESTLEELDERWSEGSREEPDEDDDGDNDDELEGVESPLVGPREGHGRVAGSVGRAPANRVPGRRVSSERVMVPNGKKPKQSG